MAKRATKQSKPIIAPIDDASLLNGAPRLGTKSRRYWEFSQAFAKGIASATGTPCIPTPVHGPMDPLVQLCVMFARTDAHELIKGDALLIWIEQTAYEFRRNAGDEFAKYRGGWTHKGLANWLTAKRPSNGAAEGSSGIRINYV